MKRSEKTCGMPFHLVHPVVPRGKHAGPGPLDLAPLGGELMWSFHHVPRDSLTSDVFFLIQVLGKDLAVPVHERPRPFSLNSDVVIQ